MGESVESVLAPGVEALQQARWSDARDAFAAVIKTEPVGEAFSGLADA